MSFDLMEHQPSEAARRRAEAAGLDLDSLRREDPMSYRMLCSVPVVNVAPQLKAHAESPLQLALDDQQLFEAGSGERLLVLAFPGPRPQQLRRLDELMGEVVEELLDDYVYYRVVQDRSGTSREFELPTSPAGWQGDATMVGPFGNEVQARDWGQHEVVPRHGFTYDVLQYAGAWFCDVFSAADT